MPRQPSQSTGALCEMTVLEGWKTALQTVSRKSNRVSSMISSMSRSLPPIRLRAKSDAATNTATTPAASPHVTVVKATPGREKSRLMWR